VLANGKDSTQKPALSLASAATRRSPKNGKFKLYTTVPTPDATHSEKSKTFISSAAFVLILLRWCLFINEKHSFYKKNHIFPLAYFSRFRVFNEKFLFYIYRLLTLFSLSNFLSR
jgi:hypothetical protein